MAPFPLDHTGKPNPLSDVGKPFFTDERTRRPNSAQPPMSASDAFHFHFRENDPSDLTIVSEDGVSFAVQRQKLLERSSNRFDNHLVSDDVNTLSVTESSEVINLILLAFYDLELASSNPSLDQIGRMILALPKYGFPLDVLIVRGCPIYRFIIELANDAPLDTFALVCHYNMEELAVEISPLLLSVPLLDLTEEQSIMMGPSYLRRFISLYLNRRERLKAILRPTPAPHQSTTHCGNEEQQQNIETIWGDTTGDLLRNNDVNMPVSLLETELNSIVEKLACDDCKEVTRERIRQVIDEWSSVKRTI